MKLNIFAIFWGLICCFISMLAFCQGKNVINLVFLVIHGIFTVLQIKTLFRKIFEI